MCPAWRWCSPMREGRNARAAGWSSPKWAPTPPMTISATAARRPSDDRISFPPLLAGEVPPPGRTSGRDNGGTFRTMNPQRAGWLVAAAALIADQLSKNYLLYGLDFRSLGPAARIAILPFFDLVMVWNRGVSYGLFQAGSFVGTLVLTGFSLAAVVALSWGLMKAERPILGVGLGLVIGGALGNVIARILYGAVGDFFRFYAFGHDWYVFKVAAAAITVGVVVLLLDAFIRPESKSVGSRQSGD